MNGLHVLFAIGLALLILAALANALRGRENPAASAGLHFQRTRPAPKLPSMGVQDGTSPSK